MYETWDPWTMWLPKLHKLHLLVTSEGIKMLEKNYNHGW